MARLGRECNEDHWGRDIHRRRGKAVLAVNSALEADHFYV